MITVKRGEVSTKTLLISDLKIKGFSEDGLNAYRTLSEELSNLSGEPLRIAREVVFQLGVSFEQLPEKPVQSYTPAVTTPSVLNVERMKLANTGSITITDFLYGQNGQEITLLGDGYTTIANNTKIKTSIGSSKLLATNLVYRFIRFDGVWYEQATGAGTTYSYYDKTTTGSLTMTSTFTEVDADSTTGNITLTLPVASTKVGYVIVIVKTSVANTVTVDCAENINGAASVALTSQWEVLRLVSRSTEWRII
jgi:hypothetical protein